MHPTKEKIINLIDDARKGELVLPEFQRSFIWERRPIEELLVSIFSDFFIGTFLILDVIPESPPFGPRLIEGVSRSDPHPHKMVLDGQQRLTSVYYALYGPDISLKNTSYPYRFFLRIDDALNGDLENAIFSWPTYWKKTEELFRDRTSQYSEGVLALSALRDWDIWETWKNGYRDFHSDADSLNEEMTKRLNALCRMFLMFEVAIVELPQRTSLETVVEVFERINRTGEPLSVFELLTARLWKYEINLRELWEKTCEEHDLISSLSDEKSERYPKFTLQLIALLRGKECKRKELILLEGDNFFEDWETASIYIENALKRMRSTGGGGYGAIPAISFPYTTMVPPLAYILHEIDSNYPVDPSALDKLHRWYWSSIFRERYGGSTDTLTYRDINEMIAWFKDDQKVPEAILDDPSQLQRNLHDVVRVGAMYRGILSLISLEGACDFYKGETIELHQLDDHHIFPSSVLRGKGYEADQRNTILNRTLISSETNRRFIRNQHTSKYIQEMEDKHTIDGTKRILETHFINEKAYQAMKNDDYETFLEAREKMISGEIIRRCMGN